MPALISVRRDTAGELFGARKAKHGPRAQATRKIVTAAMRRAELRSRATACAVDATRQAGRPGRDILMAIADTWSNAFADLRALDARQRNAVIASYLGWTLDAFDFFLLVFVLKDIAAEFKVDVAEVTFALLLKIGRASCRE